MPGENCAVFGCGSCRRTKGLGIFKLPRSKDEEHKKWREAWLSEITKTREKNSEFQRLIDNDTVFTCEKHFKPDDIEIFESAKMTKRKVKFGALPTENMPKKSHETPKPPQRPAREIVKEIPSSANNKKYYKGLTDVCKRIKGLKTISEWIVEERMDRVVLRKMKDCFQLPELELIIDDSLGYTISVYGWFLPEDHELYSRSLRSMNNVTVSDLIRDIECQLICPGVYPKELTGDIIPHVIPKVVDPLYSDDESDFDVFPKKQFWRPSDCNLLCSPTSDLCVVCMEHSHVSDLKARAKQRRLSEPAHVKAPVSSTAPERNEARNYQIFCPGRS